jgi:hypothetical protein
MTDKEKLVKAFVHVRQSWVETTGGTEIFRSANVALGHAGILVIPVTHWDISDQYFAEITFYPRALESQPVKSLKAFIPKNEIVLIVELKSPEGMSALGYKKVAGE